MRVLGKNIYDNLSLLINDNDIEKILPHHSSLELTSLLTKIFGDIIRNGKMVAFQFEFVK